MKCWKRSCSTLSIKGHPLSILPCWAHSCVLWAISVVSWQHHECLEKDISRWLMHLDIDPSTNRQEAVFHDSPSIFKETKIKCTVINVAINYKNYWSANLCTGQAIFHLKLKFLFVPFYPNRHTNVLVFLRSFLILILISITILVFVEHKQTKHPKNKQTARKHDILVAGKY